MDVREYDRNEAPPNLAVVIAAIETAAFREAENASSGDLYHFFGAECHAAEPLRGQGNHCRQTRRETTHTRPQKTEASESPARQVPDNKIS